MGNVALKISFPKLYNFFLIEIDCITCVCDKLVKVRNMGERKDGIWRWEWKWRRELFERKKIILNNFLNILSKDPLS